VGSKSAVIDPETTEVKTSYCIPLWLRDQQVRWNIKKVPGRVEPGDLRKDAVAIVAFGPSLKDTWKDIGKFQHVITMSGSHKFLLKKYKPSHFKNWWHIEVDPRAHKIGLMGKPRRGIQYLLASCVHPKLIEHLNGKDVKLWHVFANDKDRGLVFPKGEWSLTGGANVGLRAMAIARFMGFTKQEIFGMDCCARDGESHAEAHPNGPKKFHDVSFLGHTYKATSAMVAYARQFFHELEQLGDVEVKLHGIGLLQHMAFKRIMLNDVPRKSGAVGAMYPKTLSDDYLAMQRQLHEREDYGVSGAKRANTVVRLVGNLKTNSVLDYGCGKGLLAKELPFPIWEYDPAVPGKDEPARPADLVVCSDVLEHIEPEFLDATLSDLARVTLKVGYFVIHTGPAAKSLPDGRNAHLIQKDEAWWKRRLGRFFSVGKVLVSGPELHVVVGPKKRLAKAA
jgi:hypothetical protein